MSAYVEIADAQFENVNELRNYPFESLVVDSDGVEFPTGLLVDAHFFIPDFPFGGSSDSSSDAPDLPIVRMSSFHLSSHMLSACFSYVGGSCSGALSVTIASSRFKPYFPYRLEPVGGSENAGGIVSFGNVEFPDGPNTKTFTDARINPCCVAACRPAGVRAFVDHKSGESISGDVRIDFSNHVIAKRVGNAFALELEKGSDSELASACAKISGSDACGATPIRSINGIRPDDDGNIVLWFH